jgi:hypothetical protein
MQKKEKSKDTEKLRGQIKDLQAQVKSATLEMEVMRARMNDLVADAERAGSFERFQIPDEDGMKEINETVAQIGKAIQKEQKRRIPLPDRGFAELLDPDSPALIDERLILIVLKLRRKNLPMRLIASHLGIDISAVFDISRHYGSVPSIQDLVEDKPRTDFADYLLIH